MSNVQDELNSALKGKTLLLRNFYSGNDLVYDEDGAVRGDPEQGPWTLANVEIAEIAIAPQGIEIVGNRMGTWYRNGQPSFVKVGKLKIHVTKPTTDAASQASLQPIFKKIFVAAGEDLRPMMPDFWQAYLDGNDSKSRKAAWEATLKRDKKPILDKSDVPRAKVEAPSVISKADPAYTKEAASKHVEGVSSFLTIIDPTGKATNLSILEPLGMGLDEQGAVAIKQWKFKPAERNGQSVPVQLNVQLTFRCCH